MLQQLNYQIAMMRAREAQVRADAAARLPAPPPRRRRIALRPGRRHAVSQSGGAAPDRLPALDVATQGVATRTTSQLVQVYECSSERSTVSTSSPGPQSIVPRPK